MLAPLLAFQIHKFEQVPLVAERFPLCMTRLFFKASSDRRQMQFTEMHGQLLSEARITHCSTADPLSSRSSKLASETSATAGGIALFSLRMPLTLSAFSLPSSISPSSNWQRGASSTCLSFFRCQFQNFQIGLGRAQRCRFAQRIPCHPKSARGKQVLTIAIVFKRARLSHQPVAPASR